MEPLAGNSATSASSASSASRKGLQTSWKSNRSKPHDACTTGSGHTAQWSCGRIVGRAPTTPTHHVSSFLLRIVQQRPLVFRSTEIGTGRPIVSGLCSRCSRSMTCAGRCRLLFQTFVPDVSMAPRWRMTEETSDPFDWEPPDVVTKEVAH